MRGMVNSRECAGAGLGAEARAQLVVVEQAAQRARERAGVARRDDEPGDAVEIGVRDAGREVRRHDRRPRRVGLDLHEAERLAASDARQAEDVGRVIPGGELVVARRRQEASTRSATPARRASCAQLAFERARRRSARGRRPRQPSRARARRRPCSTPAGRRRARCGAQRAPRAAPRHARGRRATSAMRSIGSPKGTTRHLPRARREERRVLDHVGRRDHDEVDRVEEALQERPVRGEQALLPHDVAVVEHDARHVGASHEERELAPRVRRVEVEDVGTRSRPRASRAGRSGMDAATGADETLSCLGRRTTSTPPMVSSTRVRDPRC